MTEPWEIDPTDPDRDGADRDGDGAGAMGGDSAGDTTLPPPLQPPEDIDRTNPFEPTGGTSTPYLSDNVDEEIELTNMSLDELGFSDDVPLLTSITEFTSEENKQTIFNKSRRYIKDKFPKVDFRKLGSIGFSKRPENVGEIVQFGKGKQLGETRVFKKDGSGLLKSFKDRFKTSLGPSAQEILEKENQEVRESKQKVQEAEKRLKEDKRIAAIKQNVANTIKELDERIRQVKARRAALEEDPDSTSENQTEIDRL